MASKSLITNNLKLLFAQTMFDDISSSDNSYYVAIGKVNAFADDTSIPNVNTSIEDTEYRIWERLLAAKKVNLNDIRYVATKNQWTSNTIYTEYDIKTVTSETNDHFVISTNRNVYKCVFNNRGTRSIVEPTGTSTNIIQTSDGYKWKFLYNIDLSENDKFSTDNFIPVKIITTDDNSLQFDVQQAATNGSIDVIDVTANGSGYATVSGTFANVSNSTAIELAVGANTTDGFFTGYNVFITGGKGATQLRNITGYDGDIRRIIVNTAFSPVPNTSSSYVVSPKVAIVGDGQNAIAYSNVVEGQIKSVTVINNGSNYSQANVVITSNSGSGATAEAFVAPFGGHGKLPFKELNAHNLMISKDFNYDENGNLFTDNNFRSIAIIKNPLQSNTGAIASLDLYDLTTTLNLTSWNGTPFDEDEKITGGTTGTFANVVSFSNSTSSTATLNIVNLDGTFSTESITGANSGAVATVSSINNNELDFYSGEVVYVENRSPIQRNTKQREKIKVVFQF